MEKTKLKSFKDLKIWQGAVNLTALVYKTTEKFPSSELYGITNQMRRAAVSIGSNIAEGFKRFHKKEKLQFYNVAHGSIGELESQIEIAYNLNFLSKEDYQKLISLITEISKMICSLIKSTDSKTILNSNFYFLNSNKGFTIIELLVAMGIFLVVVSIAIGGFVQALRTQRQTISLINANNNMSLALEQMNREIRTGYNFCASGLPTYCDKNNGQIFSFINAYNDQIVYALGQAQLNGNCTTGASQPNAICRSVNSGNYQALTAPDIIVSSLNFNYGANCINPSSGKDLNCHTTLNNMPNFVTISLEFSPSGINIPIYLQTSVSSRVL